MSRTFINQSSQIGGSEEYNDSLPVGSNLENQGSLQGDLNALRSMLKQVVNPQGNWYDQPTASLSELSAAFAELGTTLEAEIAGLQASVGTVQGDVATINTTLSAQAGEIDAVELSVATLQTQVGLAESNISTLSTSLAATDVNVATLQGEMQSAQANISLLTTNLATTDSNVSALQGEVLTAQGNITTLQSGLLSAQGSITDLQADLGNAEGSIATLQLDVSNLSTQQNNTGVAVAGLVSDLAATNVSVSGLDARLTTAEGEIDTLQGGLSTAEGNITSLDGRLTTAEGEIDTLQSDLLTAQGNISTLQSDVSTAQGDISTLQSTVATHGTDISTLQGQVTTLEGASTSQGSAISTLQSDVSALQSDVSGKVAKSGDAMVGGLTITPANLGNALALTTVGSALTISDAVDGQFFEINTSLQQMTFTDPLGSGNVAIIDPAEVVVSTNDGQGNNLARTNIMSGVIELVQNGAAAVPTLGEHAVNKAYADTKLALAGGTMSGSLSMGSNSLTDLVSPSSANDAATKGYVDAVALGLKIKAPVEAKYDFAGGLAPDVPALPSEPASISYLGTIYTVTTEGELDNALGAAVDGDVIYVPQNTTVTLTSSKTINKSIRVCGKSQANSVITASFAVAANSGLFIVSGKKADGVTQNNNVQFDNLAITSSSNANDHACVVANTLSAQFANGSTGLRFDKCTFNHTEFGITVAADSWVVKDCTFNYIPTSGASDTHRHMGIYNIGTMGWVESCDFKATTEATPRTIAMLLTASDYIFTPGATASGGFSGNLVVKGCTQSSGNMRQWFVQEVFKANGLNSAPMAEHGFSLWFSNNTVGQTSSGTIIAYEGGGSKAPLNFYDTVYLKDNSFGDSSGTKKGAFAVDGLGTKRSAGAPTNIYAENNTGTVFSTALSGTYVQGSDSTNMVAVNSTYFDTPSPLLAVVAPTAGGPLLPSGTGVDVGSYTVQAGDRVFVVNAYDPTQSGIYVCTMGDWAYADDWTGDVASSFFFVKQGSYADTSWVEVSDPALVGQNFMSFAQFSGPGTYTGTGAINVSAQNVISVSAGGITNDMLAGSIELSKLASPVYTQAQVDSAITVLESSLEAEIALKLSLDGGTMSGDLAMGGNAITELANITANSPSTHAANKQYVDDVQAYITDTVIPGIDGIRNAKMFATLIQDVSANNLVAGWNGTLNGSLIYMNPNLSEDEFARYYDVYVNGQLMRPGLDHDFVNVPASPDALKFKFDLVIGDVICVVGHTATV